MRGIPARPVHSVRHRSSDEPLVSSSSIAKSNSQSWCAIGELEQHLVVGLVDDPDRGRSLEAPAENGRLAADGERTNDRLDVLTTRDIEEPALALIADDLEAAV